MEHPPPYKPSGAWRRLAPLILLSACILWVNLDTLSGPARLTAHKDNLDGANPLRLEAARQWHSGQVPLWNPYKRAGMPLLADTTAGALYPGNFPFLLRAESDRFRALDDVVVVNALLAGLFMFTLLRSISLGTSASVFGGLVYACNGTMVWFSAFYVQMQNSAVWLPLILTAVHKASTADTRFWPWVAVGGGGVALQFFAGYPEYSFYSGLLAVGYGLTLMRGPRWWRPVAAVAAIYVAGILLSAVQLLPSIELQSLSRRPLELTLEMFQSLPVSPWLVLGWPLPGTPLVPPYPLGGHHLGLAATVLLPAGLCSRGRPRWFFTIVLLLGFLMAIGPATPVSGWAYHLPGINAFRHPFKHLLEVAFAAAGLAALGADRVLRGERSALILTAVGVAATVAAFLLATPEFEVSTPTVSSLAAIVACALGAMMGRREIVLAVALAASCLGYLANQRALMANVAPWYTDCCSGPPTASGIEPGWRVMSVRHPAQRRAVETLFGDYPTEAQVLGVQGAGPYLWTALADATGTIEEETTFHPNIFAQGDATLAVLSGRYAVATRLQTGEFVPDLGQSVYRLVAETPFARLMERTDALPRFRFVRQVRCADRQTIDTALHDGGANLADLALVSCEAGRDRPSRAAYSSGKVRIVDERPGRIALATSISEEAPGFLVVGQSDYPGWKAYANGAEQPIRDVYGFLQGVEVPSGDGNVVLEYDPHSFLIGATVSVTTLLALLGAALWQWQRPAGA